MKTFSLIYFFSHGIECRIDWWDVLSNPPRSALLVGDFFSHSIFVLGDFGGVGPCVVISTMQRPSFVIEAKIPLLIFLLVLILINFLCLYTTPGPHAAALSQQGKQDGGGSVPVSCT
jgi:hypothetical protein